MMCTVVVVCATAWRVHHNPPGFHPLPRPQVKPRQGDAILFHSAHVNGTFDRHSLHGACPVVSGTKWSMAKWLRNQGTD